ncbi:MAG: class I SAM-dependent methyltransferase [Gaiellaceae bacterium]
METNEAQRRRWNDEYFASLWPRQEQITDQVTGCLLDALALRPGERVLDVGSGGGRATIAAARAVGPGGSAVGADVSSPLSRLAAERAVEAGVGNVAFRVVDVQTDPVEGAPFDAAMSQFGVMFFDEPVTAFTNIRAQLGEDARLAFACWQSAERNPWFPLEALAPFVPPFPEPAPRKSPTGPFALADPGRTAGILEASGFTGVVRTTQEVDADVTVDPMDDVELTYRGVRPDELDAARAALDAHLEQFRLPSGLCRFPLRFQLFQAVAA